MSAKGAGKRFAPKQGMTVFSVPMATFPVRQFRQSVRRVQKQEHVAAPVAANHVGAHSLRRSPFAEHLAILLDAVSSIVQDVLIVWRTKPTLRMQEPIVRPKSTRRSFFRVVRTPNEGDRCAEAQSRRAPRGKLTASCAGDASASSGSPVVSLRRDAPCSN
jgi:hypothetical protein